MCGGNQPAVEGDGEEVERRRGKVNERMIHFWRGSGILLVQGEIWTGERPVQGEIETGERPVQGDWDGR